MGTKIYRSVTDFDRQLVLDIEETDDGRQTHTIYRGFISIEEAQEFAVWWRDRWEFGYSGHATVEGSGIMNYVVRTSRWNSCD